MNEFDKKERGKKNDPEISTFTIPYTMGVIDENISINTHQDNKLSKEEIINIYLLF